MYTYREQLALDDYSNEIRLALFSANPTERCGFVCVHSRYQSLNELVELPTNAQAQKGDLSYDNSASN